MADSYLAIAQIANDPSMNERVHACAAQQQNLGADIDSAAWGWNNRYRWASSPSWGEKWDYALATHPDDPDDRRPYQPGADPAVITDDDILATVQALISQPEPAQLPTEP
jgi:hypothetical protein